LFSVRIGGGSGEVSDGLLEGSARVADKALLLAVVDEIVWVLQASLIPLRFHAPEDSRQAQTSQKDGAMVGQATTFCAKFWAQKFALAPRKLL